MRLKEEFENNRNVIPQSSRNKKSKTKVPTHLVCSELPRWWSYLTADGEELVNGGSLAPGERKSKRDLTNSLYLSIRSRITSIKQRLSGLNALIKEDVQYHHLETSMWILGEHIYPLEILLKCQSLNYTFPIPVEVGSLHQNMIQLHGQSSIMLSTLFSLVSIPSLQDFFDGGICILEVASHCSIINGSRRNSHR